MFQYYYNLIFKSGIKMKLILLLSMIAVVFVQGKYWKIIGGWGQFSRF